MSEKNDQQVRPVRGTNDAASWCNRVKLVGVQIGTMYAIYTLPICVRNKGCSPIAYKIPRPDVNRDSSRLSFVLKYLYPDV